jgi:hypothetical protein
MAAVNAATNVTHEGPLTLARRHHLINTSVLQSGAQPLSALGFLILSDTQPLIARIHPVPKQWQEVSVINSKQDDFFRWLKSIGVAERVHGDVGRRAKLHGSNHLFGEIDYGPGLWLHSDLVLPYARWMAAKLVPPQKTPLISFLEKHLKGPAVARALKPKSVAIAFAGEVNTKAMKDLEAVDKLMIADGVSASERTEVLRARVDAMQGA